jgi:O-antigen ligase
MRVYLMYFMALGLSAYAWRDWFPAVGGLVFMMAFLDNPDMPREMFGVPGLNLWNFLFFFAVPAWLSGRRREGLRWDLPTPALALLGAYVLVIVVAFLRLVLDPGPITLGPGEIVREYLLNPLKYLVPAVMVFDGVRSRSRLVGTVVSILAVYVLLAVLVVKWVPLSEAVSGGELGSRALRRLDREIGFFRTGLSVMLAGASWSLICARSLIGPRLRSLLLVGLATFVVFAQALTGGRGGYLAWACVGLVLGLLRWRIYLLLAPIVVSIVLALAPGVRGRALEGLSGEEENDPGTVNTEVLSAGRLAVWPYMLAKVGDSPLVGFGRLGYQRSGLYAFLTAEVDATFPHPHNAYLEWLLDNGWLGLALVVVLYGAVVVMSLRLFTDSRHPFYVAAGGMAFALAFSQLVGGMTGRSFYPNEETVGMWASVGLMLRVWVERSRRQPGPEA